MSLSRDTLLFSIALIVFGNWIEVSGLGGWPFAVAGIVLAAIAFLGSLLSIMLSPSDVDAPVDDGDQR